MKIFGHRGACGYEPENTIASFKKALDLNVDMIELDVHVLRSGELVVMHDTMVDRTTNGTGYVGDFTFSDLRRLDAGNGERVPLLSEVFDLINQRVPINIEMKGLGTARHVGDLITKYKRENGWSDDSFVASSFDHIELAVFKEMMPTVQTGALVEGTPMGYAAFAEQLGSFSANISSEFVTPAFVEDAHKRNMKVYVFTVNNRSEVGRMHAIGVDGIFTNFPDRARSYLSEAVIPRSHITRVSV